MASQQPMKKGAAYETVVLLPSQANTKIFQTNPTIATGDAKVSIDGGALANLATTPTVVGTSELVKINLSASETDGDYIVVVFSDQSGDEWCDMAICWHTVTNQFDDLATSTALATAQTDLDTLTGSDGATLATSQPNYAPATAAALATVDGIVDSILVDTGTDIPASIAALNDVSSSDVQTAATAALNAYDPPTKAELDSGLAALNDLSQADVRTAVGMASADLDTQIDAVLAAIAALNDLDAAGIRTALGLASANLDTQLDALPTTAEVNAQVLDVLNTDTFAELSSVPGATATLTQMIRWLYMLARNRITQTATTSTVYADDGSTSVATSTVSDDNTTFVRGEWS